MDKIKPTIAEQLTEAVQTPVVEVHPLHAILGSDEDMRQAIQKLSDLIQDLEDRVSALENPDTTNLLKTVV